MLNSERISRTFIAIGRITSLVEDKFGRKLTDEETAFLAGIGSAIALDPENNGLTTDQLFDKAMSSLDRLTQ